MVANGKVEGASAMRATASSNRAFKGVVTILAALSGIFAGEARAQEAGPPGECANGACGTPNNNGGGGCGCGGGSVLVNNTDNGTTYEQADDSDGDGIDDSLDNCPYTPNTNQSDVNGDGVGDVCDDCVGVADKAQAKNPCGDTWESTDTGFATSYGVNNNVGQVIGDVCDESSRPTSRRP